MSELEETLALHLRAAKVKAPGREVCFAKHMGRRWRFDFAWPGEKLAVEVEGGTWARGRHTRGDGFEKDCEKYNTAVLLGWRVLRFTAGQVESGEALGFITKAIGGAK